MYNSELGKQILTYITTETVKDVKSFCTNEHYVRMPRTLVDALASTTGWGPLLILCCLLDIYFSPSDDGTYKNIKYDKSGYAYITHLGERVGEICCIRWDDIHWDGHYMTIWQQNLPQFSYDSENHPVFLGYQVKENLKAGHAERNVPMSPAVEEILRFIQNVQTELGIKTDYVFSDEQGAPKRPRCFERAVKSVLEAAGWTRKRGGLHLLRFSFVSNVNGKAATGKEVQAYVGHEDYSTTENTYHILSEIPEKDAGQRISAVYGDFGGIIPVSGE